MAPIIVLWCSYLPDHIRYLLTSWLLTCHVWCFSAQ